MTLTETIFTLLDILGTVAFAISGTIVALEKRADIFGVVLLGCITSFGGGVTRDMILGNLPPRLFTNFIGMAFAVGVSILVFLIAARLKERFRSNEPAIDNVVNVFDAIGVGVFTVTGMQVAIELGHYGNWILTIFSGTVTAIGGGLLRDIIIREIPFVLKKRIYALASIIGGIAFYLLFPVNETLAMILGILLPFIIRLLATKYEWDLPKAF